MLLLLLLLFLLPLLSAAAAVLPPPPSPQSQPPSGFFHVESNCPTHCGDLEIPFPFGTKQGCYLNKDFLITCNATGTPLLGYSNTQVLNISVDGELRISTTIAHDCYNKSGFPDGNSRSSVWDLKFPVSNTRNKFTAVGCDTYALVKGTNDHPYATGCIAYCDKRKDVVNGSCAGVGCCQASIPKGVRGFDASLSSYNNHKGVWNFNPCSYAFVVEENVFNFSTLDLKGLRGMKSFPVVLDWSVGNLTCKQTSDQLRVLGIGRGIACMENSVCYEPDHATTGYRCKCSPGYRGNPYLRHGCQGTWVSASVSVVFLLIYLIFMGVHKRKLIMLKREYFKQNGGILLQQLLFKTSSSSSSSLDTARIFTEQELNLATNNFNKSMEVGRGGFGVVYKGTLSSSDAATVAIKKSMAIDRTQIHQFVNEIIVLSQIHHPNAVKLLGCCLETTVPLLVYEFITNGTLFQHLHSTDFKGSLPWDTRLRIAIETASALAHMHSVQIIHRDVKSANILLDDSFTAKVADFGVSRLVPFDQDQISTLVQGTLGYMDPEYFQSGILTEKSDVYSFGVLLAELLTGKMAISSECKEKSLALHFLCSLKEEYLMEILEYRIKEEGDVKEVSKVANVARSCLKLEGEQRPSMKTVLDELQALRKDQVVVVESFGEQSPPNSIAGCTFQDVNAR
ncbi:Wall-associated receptor kinase 5 [Linum perenne]